MIGRIRILEGKVNYTEMQAGAPWGGHARADEERSLTRATANDANNKSCRNILFLTATNGVTPAICLEL